MEELSIADLTVDEEDNKMEITRNPFDSQLCDKENYPGLDASIFAQTKTPEREVDEFRWSVGQIALMNPAELDTHPNQEYSISYSRKEDEIRDQQEVNEYFQNVLLPSPWLEDNGCHSNLGEMLKRVTFSPHPPSMRYIPDNVPDNNSSDSNDVSVESVEKDVQIKKVNFGEVTTMSDACCQTKITIPMNFDFEALLENQFCSYTELSAEGKDLMVSTLRRKLFDQEQNDDVITGQSPPSSDRVTSSPRKAALSSANSSARSMLDGSVISPVKKNSSGSSMSVFSSPCSPYSPKQASNVGSPSFARNIDMSLSSVDVSPIGSCEKKKFVIVDGGRDECSFMPEVSFDLNESDCVKESSRAIEFGLPDVSPIQNSKKVNSLLGSSTVMDSMEIRENCLQSIKESTARNVHAFSGIDISSIGNGTRQGDTKTDGSSLTSDVQSIKEEDEVGGEDESDDDDVIVKENIEDDGPLDITELFNNDDNDDDDEEVFDSEKSDNCNYSYTSDDESANKLGTTTPLSTDPETSPGSVKKLDANTPETVVNTTLNMVAKVNKDSNCNDTDTPILTTKMLERHHPSSDSSTSPLKVKGILKKSDSVTPTRTLSENSTRYNTLCNSGKKRPVPKFSFDYDTPPVKSHSLPKPSIINRSLTDEFDLESDIDLHFKCDRVKIIDHLNSHDGLISLRANSVLRRANNVMNRFDIECATGIGDENKSPVENRVSYDENDKENLPVKYFKVEENSDKKTSNIDAPFQRPSSNLTEQSGRTSSIANKTDTELLSSDLRADSGICSMEWSSDVRSEKSKRKSLNSDGTGITPLTRLTNKLNITDRVPWSARKVLCDSARYSSNSLNRYSSPRIHASSLGRSRSFIATPKSTIPRSRVVPGGRSRNDLSSWKRLQMDFQYGSGGVLSAYKDLLPSPLK